MAQPGGIIHTCIHLLVLDVLPLGPVSRFCCHHVLPQVSIIELKQVCEIQILHACLPDSTLLYFKKATCID